MDIQFRIRYSTQFGQTVFLCGDHPALGNMDLDQAVPMIYNNAQEWSFTIALDLDEPLPLRYYFLVKDERKDIIQQEWKNRTIHIDPEQFSTITIIDTWSSPGLVDYAFDTMAFDTLIEEHHHQTIPTPEAYNAIFEISAPLLPDNQIVCLLGDHPGMGTWRTEWPVLMNKVGRNLWQAKVQLYPINGEVEYKYGLYDIQQNEFNGFEEGFNRSLEIKGLKKEELIKVGDEQFGRSVSGAWRGTGVAIPVFSIRTEDGLGVGEFQDLKKLADWSATIGMKMLQILPINDTTASHTWVDSYPYAAISVFALHPIFLNVDNLPFADTKAIKEKIEKNRIALNRATAVDYEKVMKVKWEIIKEIFKENSATILEDTAFKSYLEENKNWLPAYAAFCYLRDKFETPDFSEWEAYAVYEQEKIDELLAPTNPVYNEIAIHYFVQYQLHLQLIDAVDYVHSKGLILKGDIPIGIYRYSVDAWVAPELYHMDMQAGAPPDDFSRKGQNWGFPTYNWNKMAEDNYDWWKKRFSQLALYFDSFRIDHILGFFRIWQVPMESVEALMGFFEPAMPIAVEEFTRWGIRFDYDRFCTPFVDEYVLDRVFGEQKREIRAQFFKEEPDLNGRLQFKEAFNTQKKVEAHFAALESSEEHEALKDKLYELLSNLLFIEVKGSNKTLFHPRSNVKYTISYQWLPLDQQASVLNLYNDYFYNRQEAFWRDNGMRKLPAMKAATNMLICGEDLGMVPKSVPEVMEELGMLSLEVQRMPKKLGETFFHPKDAPYLSVVTPSSHDTSTLRGWWEEDRNLIQRYYNETLGWYGEAPQTCTPEILTAIVRQHLHSPAMWAIFPIQEYLGMSEKLRNPDVKSERINIPAIIPHYWRYRMHITLEELMKEEEFNELIKRYVWTAGRA